MPSKTAFQLVYQRDNKVKKALIDLTMVLASYPRMLIEVFTRKHFGQRYLSLPSIIILTLLMLYIPFVVGAHNFTFTIPRNYGDESIDTYFFKDYSTWFIYTGLFLVFSIIHVIEVRAYGSVFEGKRFSLSPGVLHPIFDKIPLTFGMPRLKEILVEPLPFFVLGFILWKFDQSLGMLLMICSIIYSLSYVAAYKGGDDFIMDKLDQVIFNEELEKVFVFNELPENARGVRVFSDKPSSRELRQKIYQTMSENEEIEVAH